MSTTNVTYLVTVKDNFSKATGGAKKSLGGISNLLGSINPAMIGAAAGAALVVKGFKEVITVSTKFEKSMSNVKALLGDVSKNEFAALNEQAKALGATTAFTASEAAGGMKFLAQAGFNTQQIMSALPATLNLASAGSIGLAEAADLASNVLSGYGFEANQLAAANDVMAKTFSSKNTNLPEFAESMKEVAPIASGLGIQFTEVSAAIGLLANSGIKGSKSGTALKNVFTRLANPTKQIQSTLDRLGVSVNDSDGKMRSMTDIIEQLEKSGASTADIMKIFGRIAGGSMLKLVQGGSQALKDFDKDLQNAGGTAQQIADTKLDNLAGSVTKMQSAWEGMILSLEDGSGFINKTLRAVVDDLTKGLSIMSGATKLTTKNFSFLGFWLTEIKVGFSVMLGVLKLVTIPFQIIPRLVLKLGQRFGWFKGETGGLIEVLGWLLDKFSELPDMIDKFIDKILNQVDFAVGRFIALGDIVTGIFTFDPAQIKRGVDAVIKNVKDAVGDVFGGQSDEEKVRGRRSGRGSSSKKRQLGIGSLITKGGLGAPPDPTDPTGSKLKNAGNLGADVSGAKGSKMTNINITINKLVEELNVRTTNLTESTAQIREEVSRALLTAVNDANIIAE